MSDSITNYEVTNADVAKDKALKLGAIVAPLALALIPSAILLVLAFTVALTPPAVFTMLFFSFLSLIIGAIVGFAISGGLLFYRSKWLSRLRDTLAIDGIKAEEVRWFSKEITSEEKRSLKAIEAKDALLGDAYRETLASRLTATRIINSTTRELMSARRRKSRLKQLKSVRVTEYEAELTKDIENLSEIKKEAIEMRTEAQSRLQMIDAASRRGAELEGKEIALKKLSERAKSLPLALENAKAEDEIRRDLMRELNDEFN
ncbi:MAG: hypothetical protein ACK5NT_00495 [Pyrinomonadaceae bacterium]